MVSMEFDRLDRQRWQMVFCGIGYFSAGVFLRWRKRGFVVVNVANANYKSRKLALAAYREWKVIDATSEVKGLWFRRGDFDGIEFPHEDFCIDLITDGDFQKRVTGVVFQVSSQLNTDRELAVLRIFIDHLDEEFLASSQLLGPLRFAEPIVDADIRKGVVDCRWLIVLNDGSIQSSASGSQVVFELQGGDLQRASIVTKTFGGHAIGRQVSCVVHFESEKVFHGVLVFDSIESSQDDTSVGLPAFDQGCLDRMREPVGRGFQFFARELFFVGRGHLVGLQYVEHFVPGFRRGAVVAQIDRKVIEANVCFLNLGAMATDAMGLKDGEDIAMEVDRFLVDGFLSQTSSHRDREDAGQAKENRDPQDGARKHGRREVRGGKREAGGVKYMLFCTWELHRIRF